jgi:hypothetical protein
MFIFPIFLPYIRHRASWFVDSLRLFLPFLTCYSSSSLPLSSASVWVYLMATPIVPMEHCLPHGTFNGWRMRVPDYPIAKIIPHHSRMGVFRSHCSKLYTLIPTAHRMTSRMTSQAHTQRTNPALSVCCNNGEKCVRRLFVPTLLIKPRI